MWLPACTRAELDGFDPTSTFSLGPTFWTC
jgi:hypothetical protein